MKLTPTWISFMLHARFTSLHFEYISLRLHFRLKLNFATWSMIKEKDFSQLTFSLFKKMDERKQLTMLISCLSSIWTSALLLLQLQAVIALKIAQQQSSMNKGVLKNFAVLTGKHLRWSPFLKKLQLFRASTLLRRDSNTGVFLSLLWNF